MRAERLPRGAVGLVLTLVALLSSGCASLPSRAGPGGALAAVSGATPMAALGRSAVARLPEDDALEDSDDEEAAAGPLLHRRRATPSPPNPGGGETRPLRVAGALAGMCGEVPPGWPHLDSDEAVLAPFLACTTPAAFLALQRQVDMPQLVEALSDWSAVRLGALGPVEAQSARVLLTKRAAFLSTAVEKHGVAKAEVLALFVLHTTHDEEVRQLLRLLAEDKLLKRALGAMEVVREELTQRGMALTDFPERDLRAGDIARGLGRAVDDVAASIPLVGGSRSVDASALPPWLPPPYRAAYVEVEKAQYLGAFAPGNVALASFDHLTFGVPLGFYYLAAGTAQGGASLAKGEYEEATRQLAPAALMVGLYAGGKGARAFRDAGPSRHQGAQVRAVVPRVEALKAVLERLEARVGESAVGELARYFQQSREAALLAAEWGDAAALALYASRGDVPKARQAMLSVANSDRAGPASKQARDTQGGVSADAVPGREAATSLPGRTDVGAKVDAKDIRGARPYGLEGRPGHPDAHGVSRQDQANIINDPKSTLYRGTNANNRPVDHYHRDGTTVVTEQGEPTRVITAFGALATKDSRGRPIIRGTGKPANPLPNGGPYEKLR
ncbi:HNH endonuclease [Myxococcus xanthus]|uniref:HNH endonuclease n=1 Tax=Myxococcus xanthus TaxID=34 RepID=UPI0020A34840|nr:HNH endonuclease [Myxococcus xanthus]